METGQFITIIVISVSLALIAAIFAIKIFLNKKGSQEPQENDERLQIQQQHEALLKLQIENQHLSRANEQLNAETILLREQIATAKAQIASLETNNTHLHKANEEKIKEINELHNKLTVEFENIANRVLTHRSKEFSEANQQKISDLLSPLKDKISSFEKKVEETYDKEVRDKLSLQSEVKRLFELNQKISQEANNLTRALKGDIKKQGNWGEMILERVLEQSGLTKDREYRREVADKNAEGNDIRPDVIIDLPDNKHLVIDSKLSLSAYDDYVNAETNAEQEQAIKRHKVNMREHIKGLFEKNYASASKLNSPDFVLLFIPVEASFAAVVESDNEIFNFAWERKIVLVSPSTLLATLKTVASIWKQENQTKNAMEIARQSGALYDKLVGFLADMDKIGQSINQLQNTYALSVNKLQSGRGNIISRAESIRELGAKNTKAIPDKFKPQNDAIEDAATDKE